MYASIRKRHKNIPICWTTVVNVCGIDCTAKG